MELFSQHRVEHHVGIRIVQVLGEFCLKPENRGPLGPFTHSSPCMCSLGLFSETVENLGGVD